MASPDTTLQPTFLPTVITQQLKYDLNPPLQCFTHFFLKRLSLECLDLHMGYIWRSPTCAQVGTREQVPMEWIGVWLGYVGGAGEDLAMGEREWVPHVEEGVQMDPYIQVCNGEPVVEMCVEENILWDHAHIHLCAAHIHLWRDREKLCLALKLFIQRNAYWMGMFIRSMN